MLSEVARLAGSFDAIWKVSNVSKDGDHHIQTVESFMVKAGIFCSCIVIWIGINLLINAAIYEYIINSQSFMTKVY